MGFRFRRSWGVIPGVRFNLGLRGGSVSFGTRGLHYTVGTSGSRITVGLPGTGLFWTQKLRSPPTSSTAAQTRKTHPYIPSPGTYARPFGGQHGATALSAPIRLSPQLSQPPNSSAFPPSISAAGQSPTTTHARVFVPTWLIYSVLTVTAIGALCLGAAALGAFLR
jgi:hypothetical protein